MGVGWVGWQQTNHPVAVSCYFIKKNGFSFSLLKLESTTSKLSKAVSLEYWHSVKDYNVSCTKVSGEGGAVANLHGATALVPPI